LHVSCFENEPLQHTASHCNTLHCNTLQHTALQHIATHCNTHCYTLQHTATHCNTQCNTHCNTLQHTTEWREDSSPLSCRSLFTDEPLITQGSCAERELMPYEAPMAFRNPIRASVSIFRYTTIYIVDALHYFIYRNIHYPINSTL